MFMATLGHQSSPNSLLAQHGLRCALWVSGSRAAGLCPCPAGFGCARPRGAPDQQMQHRWREGRAFAGPSSAICWKIYEMTSTVADKETLKSFWEPLFVLLCCSLAAKASVRHAGVCAARWGMCCRQELQLFHMSLLEIHHNLPKAACSSQDWAESHKRKGI